MTKVDSMVGTLVINIVDSMVGTLVINIVDSVMEKIKGSK